MPTLHKLNIASPWGEVARAKRAAGEGTRLFALTLDGTLGYSFPSPGYSDGVGPTSPQGEVL